MFLPYLYLNQGNKFRQLGELQDLGEFNPDFNVPLTGDRTVDENSNTWQYLDPGSSNRDLDFISTNIKPGTIFFIVHTGNNRRFDVLVDGVDTGENIRRNQLWMVHFTDEFNFFRLV